jgi:DNA-binding XRE family transcriptional regulator
VTRYKKRPPDGPETPGQTWGRELFNMMLQRRIPVASMAETLGVSASAVSQARMGQYLPSMEQAAAYADALAAPSLLRLCAELRTRVCDECGKEFVENHRGGAAQRWCGRSCKWLGRYHESTDRQDRRDRYDRWMRLAKKRQRAINGFCWDCEPDGACKQADCKLRPESPLPLITVEPVGTPMTGTVRHPEDSALRRTRRLEYEREWARARRAKVRVA